MSKEKTINLISLPTKDLIKLSNDLLLSLNIYEMKIIQEHFKKLKRNPRQIELEVLAQTWSEHCKHKTFNALIDFEFNGEHYEIDSLFKSFIKKSTDEISKKKKDFLISVFDDNAGIISYNKNYDISVKVETHNHPSALDPYGGSMTGVGGVLRDILGCGLGGKPIAVTDVFCFANPDMDSKKVPEHILHPKRIFKGVRKGVKDYGNRLGVPTVNGAIFFDNDYLGNPLVFCGGIGLMPKGFHKKKVNKGDLIVVLGAPTGKDGLHGATFSSQELSSDIPSSVVQIGNPIEEKKLIDVIIKARDKKLFSFVTDCGAGGLSSAIGESAEGTGANVQLEKAPLKQKGLKPWEIFLSESQERMVLAVPEKNLNKLKVLCEIEEVPLTVLGKYVKTGKIECFYGKEKVLDLDLKFLHEGFPRKTLNAKFDLNETFFIPKKTGNNSKDLLKLLSSPNISSKETTVREYDFEVQGRTTVKPFYDNKGKPAFSNAAIIKADYNDKKGLVIANGMNPWIGKINPFNMAVSAIDEALRNILATGGSLEKTALLDNFCFGSPENEKILGSLCLSAKACYDMALVFNTPFISGKDSFYNEFTDKERRISVPATLLITAVSVLNDERKRLSIPFKGAGNSIYVIGKTYNELGGSAFLANQNIWKGITPGIRFKEALKTFNSLEKSNQKDLIESCHDLSDGGLAVALSEMAFTSEFGANITLKKVLTGERIDNDSVLLFSESNSRFLIEVKKANEKKLERIFGKICSKIGVVTKKQEIVIKGMNGQTAVSVLNKNALNAWKGKLNW